MTSEVLRFRRQVLHRGHQMRLGHVAEKTCHAPISSPLFGLCLTTGPKAKVEIAELLEPRKFLADASHRADEGLRKHPMTRPRHCVD
jgi:hypothetical protein